MSFIGAWRVSEAVYDAEGNFQGKVRQYRRLEPVANDRFQVIQICEPDSQLVGHPMAEFAGEHRFELAIDGRLRRYLGPAVLGHGIALCEGAMIGHGVWPIFGYNFSSWAVLASAERQLTGGSFHIAGREVAVIVGLAEPDSGAWPAWPPAVPAEDGVDVVNRQGAISEAGENGDEIHRTMTRRDHQGGWVEQADSSRLDVTLSRDGNQFLLTGAGTGEAPWIGFARRFGPLLRYEVVADDATVKGFEVADESGHLAGIRRWSRRGLPDRNEVLRVSAPNGS